MKEVFKTQRLCIRNLSPNDLEGFAKLQKNPKTQKFPSPFLLAEKTDLSIISSIIELYENEENDYFVWAVEEIETQKFIGTCALIKNEKNENEIGYSIIEEFWGKGFGEELANGLVNYCCQNLHLEKVTAYIEAANLGSIRTLGKTRLKFLKEHFNNTSKQLEYVYSN